MRDLGEDFHTPLVVERKQASGGPAYWHDPQDPAEATGRPL